MREKIRARATKNRNRKITYAFTEDKPRLIDVLFREGVRLTKKGTALLASCPFHVDNTPSFKVTPTNKGGLWYCFSCHKGGDVYNFVMEAHGLDFKGAVRYLKGERLVYNPAKARVRSEGTALMEMFQEWERKRCAALGDVLRWFRQKQTKGFTKEEVNIFAPLIKRISELEYIWEILCSRNDESKLKIFMEEKGLA